MDDLIQREDAREIFSQLWDCIDEIADKEEWEDVCKTTANELPSAQQWIPCSEITEEEENEFYLATIYSEGMQKAFCDILFYGAPQLYGDGKIGWYFMNNGGMEQVFNVTAWMPLPKPYKGVEE